MLFRQEDVHPTLIERSKPPCEEIRGSLALNLAKIGFADMCAACGFPDGKPRCLTCLCTKRHTGSPSTATLAHWRASDGPQTHCKQYNYDPHQTGTRTSKEWNRGSVDEFVTVISIGSLVVG